MNRNIWVYSKLSGVNELLFIADNNVDAHDFEQVFTQDKYKKHKRFAYALNDGVEIKLFTDQAS